MDKIVTYFVFFPAMGFFVGMLIALVTIKYQVWKLEREAMTEGGDLTDAVIEELYAAVNGAAARFNKIAAQETDGANATVRRMALVAREGRGALIAALVRIQDRLKEDGDKA
jgi:hypothetical protein